MTPLPKRKHTVRRQGQRRSTIKLITKTLVTCPKCQQPKVAHVACANCDGTK